MEYDFIGMYTAEWDTELICGCCSQYLIVTSLNIRTDAEPSTALGKFRYVVICEHCSHPNPLPQGTRPYPTNLFVR